MLLGFILTSCNMFKERDNYKDFGLGVYYFENNGETFSKDLSKFLKSHDSLEVIVITPNNTGMFGAQDGFIVTFKPKIMNSVSIDSLNSKP